MCKQRWRYKTLHLVFLWILAVGANLLWARSEATSFTVLWGNKPEQLGLQTGSEVESVGPLTFTVSPLGDILVADSVHRCIKRWNTNGDFGGMLIDGKRPNAIACDATGRILLLEDHRVEIYLPSGERLHTILLPDALPLVEGFAQDIWMEDGLVCVNDPDEWVYCFDCDKSEPTTATKILAGRRLSDSARIFVTRQNRNVIARQIAAFSVLRRDVRDVLSVSPSNQFDFVKLASRSQATPGGVIFRSFFPQQQYYVFETEEIEGNNVHLVAKVVSAKSRLVQTLELPNDYFTTVYKKIEIMPDGTLWQMLTQPDGVKFLRWKVLP